MADSKAAWAYTGGGEHYQGIPARDLTAEEFAALDQDQQIAVAQGGIYAEVKAKKGAKADEPTAPASDTTGE